MKTCDKCGGAGGFEAALGSLDDPYMAEWTECPACHGSGWIDGDLDPVDWDDLDDYRRGDPGAELWDAGR